MNKIHFYSQILLLFTILGLASCTSPPPSSPTATTRITQTQTQTPTLAPPLDATILISEVLTGLEGNNNYEFIELYNTGSDQPMDLKGWSLWYKLSSNDSEKLVARWTKHTLVPPLGHYLLVREGEDVGAVADFFFDIPMIPQRGSLQLRLPSGAAVDSLTWGNDDLKYTEGTPADPMKTGLSLERLPTGKEGNWVDSQNNSEDFSSSTPNPQNVGSRLTPGFDEIITISLSAPEIVPPGESFQYQIKVHNNTNEILKGVTVQLPIPLSLNIDSIPLDIKPLDKAKYWGIEDINSESQIMLWDIGLLEPDQEAVNSITVNTPWTYTKIVANNYSVQAENWPYPNFGQSILTTVEGGSIPIGTTKDLVGKDVVVEGIATMYTGGYYAGSGNVKFYIEDETGGIQVWVPDGEGEVDINLGDQVRVYGNLTIYRGAFELVVNNPEDVEILTKSKPETRLSPTFLSISDAANNPSYAGRLVQVDGIIARNEEFSYSYELDLVDEIGDIITIYVDKQTNINVEAIENGQSYKATGILEIYDINQEIYPRVQEDLERVFPPILALEMDAPILVNKGEDITVTLTATNYTPDPLTELVITAPLPSRGGFQLISTSENSKTNGNKIVWNIAKLEGNGSAIQVNYYGKVTAGGEYLSFRDYSAVANEWADPTGGDPLRIFLGESVPIWAIQGPGDRTPYLFKQVTTEGIVTGVFPELEGFWIQETVTDKDPSTSSGLFIHVSELENMVVPGSTVKVSGVVREKEQQTQLVVSSLEEIENLSIGGSLPTAIPLDPPPLEMDALEYYEHLEGMLVEVKDPGVAVAPTSQYGEYVLVLEKHGVDRLWQGDFLNNGIAIMVDDGSSVIHQDRSTLPYTVNSGDLVNGLMGPLAYTYGRYKVEPIVQPQVVSSDYFLPKLDLLDENTFSLMTWNVENLFDIFDPHPSSPEKPTIHDYKVAIAKVANTILSAGTPTIVGLQEVENIEILEDIAEHEILAGFGYKPFLIDGTDSRYIDNGYLVREGFAKVLEVEQHTAPEGLTSRPPLRILVELQLDSRPLQVHLLNNHFTSMSGGETATEPRRKAQAAWNVTIMEELLNENPEALITILGDLNSYYESPPLDTMREAGFRHVFEFDPEKGWYTYIYQGASQTLDHILVTPNLFDLLQAVEVLHVNADYALPGSGDESPLHKSDHDPVIAIFSLQV